MPRRLDPLVPRAGPGEYYVDREVIKTIEGRQLVWAPVKIHFPLTRTAWGWPTRIISQTEQNCTVCRAAGRLRDGC